VTLVASVGNRLSGAVLSALLHFFAAVLVVFMAALPAASRAFALEKQPLAFITANGSHEITVEVADSEEERSTGLMFRRSIGEKEGMLFIYDREQDITMWMKNTYISLDMIFVRRNGVISHIEANTEPFSQEIIGSGGPALAVVEMGAGSAKRLGLKPGDKVRHPAFK
jgi:uncharacterized protein